MRPLPGYAEQDPEAWWRSLCGAVQEAMAAAGDGVQVAAVGLSGQMHGTVLLDADGAALGPAVIWPDQRSAPQVAEITETLGLDALTAITGGPAATGFQAATLLWVRQERPEVWRQINKALLPKDYVRWRMTGESATDASDGSGSLLLDVRRRAWSPEMLAVLDMDEAQLPAVQASSAGRASSTAWLRRRQGWPRGR